MGDSDFERQLAQLVDEGDSLLAQLRRGVVSVTGASGKTHDRALPVPEAAPPASSNAGVAYCHSAEAGRSRFPTIEEVSAAQQSRLEYIHALFGNLESEASAVETGSKHHHEAFFCTRRPWCCRP